MDNARIKENIIRIRTEKGISQDEMARSLDISRNSYRSIEKGSTYVINRRLHDIAERLGVSEEELVLGYQPIESEESLEDISHQMLQTMFYFRIDIRTSTSSSFVYFVLCGIKLLRDFLESHAPTYSIL